MGLQCPQDGWSQRPNAEGNVSFFKPSDTPPPCCPHTKGVEPTGVCVVARSARVRAGSEASATRLAMKVQGSEHAITNTNCVGARSEGDWSRFVVVDEEITFPEQAGESSHSRGGVRRHDRPKAFG